MSCTIRSACACSCATVASNLSSLSCLQNNVNAMRRTKIYTTFVPRDKGKGLPASGQLMCDHCNFHQEKYRANCLRCRIPVLRNKCVAREMYSWVKKGPLHATSMRRVCRQKAMTVVNVCDSPLLSQCLGHFIFNSLHCLSGRWHMCGGITTSAWQPVTGSILAMYMHILLHPHTVQPYQQRHDVQ